MLIASAIKINIVPVYMLQVSNDLNKNVYIYISSLGRR